MSIKVKNLGDFSILISIPGTLTTTSAACGGPAPFSGIVKAVYAVLGVANTGTTNSTVDLLQNEATMVSSGSMFTFASTSKTPTYGTPTTNPPTVAKGDIFSLSVGSVGSTTAGSDLCVAVVVEKLRGTGPAAAMQTGTYGADSDAVS